MMMSLMSLVLHIVVFDDVAWEGETVRSVISDGRDSDPSTTITESKEWKESL